ncbi:MAG: Septum site-determining protein MinC [uncultured Thiotrichaceae bacterium]|uniref:Probable septum site-determining protein MinC n=1 Tax=uncultured Thiotrichaceae bacterium TaxID=298394 RepID=A0A6S6T5H6_9GAMM|nr:MAG: Septum site-determining protein MinC [uncultured Thiotrichaceae bacterium]
MVSKLNNQHIDLKGEMAMQNVLSLKSSDISSILEELQERVEQAPHFFIDTPLIVDCSKLDEDQQATLSYDGLLTGVKALSFVPVAVRNIAQEFTASAVKAGWGILPERKLKEDEKDNNRQSQVADDNLDNLPATKTTVITYPVRSGQQVIEPEGDLVVLAHSGAGSELLAAGSIHVYGKISGRVIAGMHGDTSARIFCKDLQAELIAIAGQYLLLDEAETDLAGKSAMIYLNEGHIYIEPLIF